jgi:hypothetical protein
MLTDFTYLVPPSCLCCILALRSHDFWEMTLTAKHVLLVLPVLLDEEYWSFQYRVFYNTSIIFIQPRGKYFTYINQKCYFLLWLFQVRWTDFTYLVPPSCLCCILALRSHDFWEMTLTAKHVFGVLTWKTWTCWMRVHLSWNNHRRK